MGDTMSETENRQTRPAADERPLLSRPGFLGALFFVPVGLLLTVQWDHPQATLLATSLGIAAFLILGALAWSLRRRRNSSDDVLRAGFDDNPDGIMLADTDGQILYSNSAFHRLLRPSYGAGGPQPVTSLADMAARFEGDGAAEEIRRLLAVARDGGGDNAEFAVTLDGGNVTWRHLSVHPTSNRPGAPSATLWRLEDVTARRELDQVRRLEEGKLADSLDLLPAGFFSADGDGILLYANQTLARWLGVAPDRLVGRPFADFVAEAGSEGDLKLRDAEGRIFSAVLEQSQKDTADGDVAYTRSLVLREFIWRDPAAAMAGADEAEQTADGASPPGDGAPRSDRLRWLFDEAPVGIVILDLDGTIADCNRAFLKLIGGHRDSILGTPFADRIVRGDRDDVTSGLSKIVMGTARAAQFDARLPGSDERELYTSLYASRMADEAGEISGLVLHFIDTTEQKSLEVQFTQSQKMQAVGQLAGGVAHDFNNLLTAMIGFCDLLLTRHPPDDPSFADIQQIRQNANRATNLVRQLLAFSRQQTLTPERLDVTEILSDLASLLSRLIGETVDIQFEHGPDLPPVEADRGQLDQVIINLAVNARDAMPGGGSLTVRTRATVLGAPVQRGDERIPAGRYVVIEVSDTGTGIAKKDMDHIFEPFFSTKEVGAGTGLGLSTVHGIVHQSGGYIFVDSAIGEGTTFTIHLPEAEGADQPEAAAGGAQATDEGPGAEAEEGDLTGRGTVLLVEDEDAVRMFGVRALRLKGYTVLEADNGETALDVINATDETIDLIISDVIMPGMDGHTLVNLVRHELPAVKVILMSGYADDVFQGEIDRDDSIAFLGKPFSLKQLAGKVKEVMNGT